METPPNYKEVVAEVAEELELHLVCHGMTTTLTSASIFIRYCYSITLLIFLRLAFLWFL
jgi:hypothetical protein